MSPVDFLRQARKDNPNVRYALRRPDPNCGAVLGAWCTNAGGFIPVAVQENGRWYRMPAGYLEIDGKAVGIEPENWEE